MLRSRFTGSMATRNRIRSVPWIVAESPTLNRTNDTDEDDDEDMTFGLHGMTMGTSGSDVDMHS